MKINLIFILLFTYVSTRIISIYYAIIQIFIEYFHRSGNLVIIKQRLLTR